MGARAERLETTGREATAPRAERRRLLVAGIWSLVVLASAVQIYLSWIAAEGNYARLHLDGRSVLHRSSLSALAAKLDGRFARVHRSIVVNLRHVRAVERRSHGDALVVLDDGSRLKVSRTYRKALRRLGS